MNMPHPGPNIECTSIVFARVQCARSLALGLGTINLSLLSFLGLSLLHVVHSSVGLCNSSDDRGPAGSGKTRGATRKYHSSDVMLGCRWRKKRF